MTHIIIIDGSTGSGRKMLCFELALTLIYNNQKTALLLEPDSPLQKTFIARKNQYPQLPSPYILSREEYQKNENNFDAIIIPEATTTDNLAANSATYITLIPKSKKQINNFQKNLTYINAIWELKKKIAATHKRSLNWIVCENNVTEHSSLQSSTQLEKISKTYGFRLSPPLTNRKTYFLNHTGISAQDKSFPALNKQMNYEDICAKREIIKLAEFIFSA